MTVREWEFLCPGSTQFLEELVQKNHGQLEEDLSADEATNRVVSWSRKGVGYSISMMAEDGEVRVWTTAWKDDEAALMRKGLFPLERLLPKNITPDAFETTLDEMLKHTRTRVGLLNLRGARKEVRASKLTMLTI